MNYQGTKFLLDAISPYIDPGNISMGEISLDRNGRNQRSDSVTLVEKNSVGFEVTEDGVIISYFTAHERFEDHPSDPKSADQNRFERAGEFLVRLFTLPIRHTAVWRGKKLRWEQY